MSKSYRQKKYSDQKRQASVNRDLEMPSKNLNSESVPHNPRLRRLRKSADPEIGENNKNQTESASSSERSQRGRKTPSEEILRSEFVEVNMEGVPNSPEPVSDIENRNILREKNSRRKRKKRDSSVKAQPKTKESKRRKSNRASQKSNDENDIHTILNKVVKGFEVKLDIMKKSILLDFKKKVDEIKNEIRSSYRNEESEAQRKRELLPPLPKKSLEDFLEFEELLENDKEIADGLKSLISLHINSVRGINPVFNTVLPMIMNKNVQLLYSGFGRVTVKGSKENFSKTKTYSILKEALLEKLPGVPLKEIGIRISRWFSQAGDREGGRRERASRSRRSSIAAGTLSEPPSPFVNENGTNSESPTEQQPEAN